MITHVRYKHQVGFMSEQFGEGVPAPLRRLATISRPLTP